MGSKSTAFKLNNRNWMIPVILFLTCVIAGLLYLGLAKNSYRLGFPLDDAWIHQSFARNLINHNEWSINLGEPTSGSTSPLWTALIGIGYLLKINYLWWTYFLGFVCLFLSGYLTELIVRRTYNNYSHKIPWVGIIICSEWHLIWAAFSGMEILLSAVFLLTIIFILSKQKPRGLFIGIVAGLGVWVRPDAFTWIGLILWWIVFSKERFQKVLLNLLRFLLGFLPLIVLYFSFNYALSGSIFPNTMMAKQIEYLSMAQNNYFVNFVKVFFQPLIGIGLLLFPAFMYKFLTDIKHKNWQNIGLFILVVCFIGIYAWKLPVTYQYGRYIMPIIPLLLLYSISGLIDIYSSVKKWNKCFRLLKFAWITSITIIATSFLIIGGIYFSRDVAIIESEMVDTALWINKFIPSGKVIAAHDIGGLSYFGEHKIMDLAGLISPEIIPIIRSEKQLLTHLFYSDVYYMMTFPKWYPIIDSSGFPVIYSSKMDWAKKNGYESMVIYRLLSNESTQD